MSQRQHSQLYQVMYPKHSPTSWASTQYQHGYTTRLSCRYQWVVLVSLTSRPFDTRPTLHQQVMLCKPGRITLEPVIPSSSIEQPRPPAAVFSSIAACKYNTTTLQHSIQRKSLFNPSSHPTTQTWRRLIQNVCFQLLQFQYFHRA